MSATKFAVVVKRTSDLTPGERSEICALFTEVFQRPYPEDHFLRKYRDAPAGDSFHALAILEGRIAGAFSGIVLPYRYFGGDVLFAIAIDLMLAERLRPNLGLIRRMSECLYAALTEREVAFVFSCIREEMMRFHEAVGHWRRAGRLSYQVTPIRSPHLRLLVRVANVLDARREGVIVRPITKINDDAFRTWRYSFFRTEYRTVKIDGGEAIYTGKTFWDLPGLPARMRVSLLVDVWPQSAEVFDAIVDQVTRSGRDIDYLIYAGHLPFQPRRMWRVPDRFARPRYYLGGRILRPDLVDERVYDIGNWDINLSNTDLV